MNDKAASNFVSHIYGHYLDRIKLTIVETYFFSVYSDGSTDRTESEKEIIMTRVLENYMSKIRFFLKLQSQKTQKVQDYMSISTKCCQTNLALVIMRS